MNYKAVNQLIFKNYYSKDQDRNLLGEYGEKIGYIDHGYRILLIPKEEFILDADKLLKGKEKRNIKTVVGDFGDYEDAELTNELKELEHKIVVRKIKSGGLTAWVDNKYLKEFDLELSNFIVRIGVNKQGEEIIVGVAILEDGELMGYILPVRINE